MAEFTFPAPGGDALHVRVWETPRRPRGLVLIAHGYGEHAGRYAHVAARLTAEGYLTVAPDHHGHGQSSGTPGQIDFARAVADLDALLTNQIDAHPDLPAYLIGHSMGGGIALRYAIAHQARLAGLILSGPLVRADTSPAAKLIGRLVARVAPGAPVLKLDPELVSRDPAVVAAYAADPLVRHKPITAQAITEFIRHAATIMDDARSISVPTLLLWGSEDRLCPAPGAVALSAHLGALDLQRHAFAGLYHEIFNEPEQDSVLDTVIAWLESH